MANLTCTFVRRVTVIALLSYAVRQRSYQSDVTAVPWSLTRFFMSPINRKSLNRMSMSARNRHELVKLARKEGSNVTDEELTFKKPFQTVSRPSVTDHNIHDDYLKHPPHVSSFDA